MKKELYEAFLMGLSTHDEYQRKKDADREAEIHEAAEKRKPVARFRELATGYSSSHSVLRPMTAEELADDARDRIRVIKAPLPVKPEARPSIAFTLGWSRGRWTSLDTIVLVLKDSEAGLEQVAQLEARRREDPLDACFGYCHDAFSAPIPGRSASAWADTGLRDGLDRVFIEIVGIDPDSRSGLLCGDMRAFPASSLPDRLPENVDTVVYGREELATERKRWAAQFTPSDASDRQREREAASVQAQVDAGVAEALKKQNDGRPRDALGRPVKAASA
jgi:hypothetical protein